MQSRHAIGVRIVAAMSGGPPAPGRVANLLSNTTQPQRGGRKPVERVRSGAAPPVKWGPVWTTAVKIKNRDTQVSAIFTLNRERVPLAFQAGHASPIPVTRSTETLTQQGFSRTPGRLLGRKRRSWVPSWAVHSTPPPQDQPSSWRDSTAKDNRRALRSPGLPPHPRPRQRPLTS